MGKIAGTLAAALVATAAVIGAGTAVADQDYLYCTGNPLPGDGAGYTYMNSCKHGDGHLGGQYNGPGGRLYYSYYPTIFFCEGAYYPYGTAVAAGSKLVGACYRDYLHGEQPSRWGCLYSQNGANYYIAPDPNQDMSTYVCPAR